MRSSYDALEIADDKEYSTTNVDELVMPKRKTLAGRNATRNKIFSLQRTPSGYYKLQEVWKMPVLPASSNTTHAKQRPQRCPGWEEKRAAFEAVLSETRAPSRTPCCMCGDSEGDSIRCLDCGPEAMRCIDCTMSYHKEFHLLHKPELLLETGVRPFPLCSRFSRRNHQCTTSHTKTMEVFDEKGRLHDCWFTSCACEAESATLLRWQLWPATPDRPRLAFHVELLRWLHVLVSAGQMTLKSACQCLLWRNSLDAQEVDILYANLVNGSFDEYRLSVHRCSDIISGSTAMETGSVGEASPKVGESGGMTDGTPQAPSAGIVGDKSTMEDNTHAMYVGQDTNAACQGTAGDDAIAAGDWGSPSSGHICSDLKDEPPDDTETDGSSDSETEYVYVQTDASGLPNCTYSQASFLQSPFPGVHARQLTMPTDNGNPPSPVSSTTDQNPFRLSHLSQFRPGEITIMSTANEGKTRVWDKRQYCLYCRDPYAKIPRHLEAMHKDEPDVVLLRAATCPVRRKQILCKLRNLGNHVHNSDVLRHGEGMLIVTYRPSESDAHRPEDYGPCPTCFGYYIRSDLWKHNCPLKHAEMDMAAVWLNVSLQQ